MRVSVVVRRIRSRVLIRGATALFAGAALLAAADGPGADPDPVAPAINHERILGVMPDYQTVRDPNARYVPLTAKQKWRLVALSTIDPFNIASAIMGAGLSQIANDTPRYGWGGEAYASRVGAAVADLTTQNVFSGDLAVLLHQDPRYFRLGPEHSIPKRVAYALSRLAVIRKDSGGLTFNSSSVGGMALGIAASNMYYPSASRTGTVMACRLETSITGGIIGNLMSEFWPDVQSHLFRRHKKTE